VADVVPTAIRRIDLWLLALLQWEAAAQGGLRQAEVAILDERGMIMG
jgi:hypothetical protein